MIDDFLLCFVFCLGCFFWFFFLSNSHCPDKVRAKRLLFFIPHNMPFSFCAAYNPECHSFLF